jgi:hypothetical protein
MPARAGMFGRGILPVEALSLVGDKLLGPPQAKKGPPSIGGDTDDGPTG